MEYDYYDDYNDEAYDDPDLPARSFQRELSFEETMTSCVHPSLQFAVEYILNFVATNLLFCVLVHLVNRKFPALRYLHLLSCFFGATLMYLVVDYGYFHFAQLTISLYLVQWAIHRWLAGCSRFLRVPFVITGYGIANLLLSELMAPSPEAWNRIRGTQMILLMKVLSLSFDTDENSALRAQLNVLSYAGYVLCPANIVLGPWISFSDYLSIWKMVPADTRTGRSNSRRMLVHLFRIVTSLLMAIGFLLTSNCMIDYLLASAGNSSKWVHAYSKAFSFRTSHYFVAYLSQCSMLAGAIEWNKQEDDRSLALPANSLYRVTSPLAVEFPRSLVQVVTAWNIPMHHWLKRYIFRATKRPFGTATAIAVTYTVSSLLHGLHYRLWMTLLTIGAWTYVEHELRKKIGNIYSACVLVGKCPERCTVHSHKSGTLFSIVINTLFFLLNVFNLIYLGCIFEATERPLEENAREQSLFAPWAELNFVSHWLLAFAYLFYLVI